MKFFTLVGFFGNSNPACFIDSLIKVLLLMACMDIPSAAASLETISSRDFLVCKYFLKSELFSEGQNYFQKDLLSNETVM